MSWGSQSEFTWFFAPRKGIHHKKADLWAMLHKAVKATRHASHEIDWSKEVFGFTGREKTQPAFLCWKGVRLKEYWKLSETTQQHWGWQQIGQVQNLLKKIQWLALLKLVYWNFWKACFCTFSQYEKTCWYLIVFNHLKRPPAVVWPVTGEAKSAGGTLFAYKNEDLEVRKT